jgi:hypothetical protein
MSKRLAPCLVAMGSLLVLLSSEGSASRREPDPIVVRKKGLLMTSERTIEGEGHKLLARVSARCRSTSITESDRDLAVRCSDQLVSPALGLKADAILGLHVLPIPFSESAGRAPWLFPSGVSGIAVQTLEAGQTGSTRRVPFVVAVPPQLGHPMESSELRSIRHLIARIGRRARRGFSQPGGPAGDRGGAAGELALFPAAASGPWIA